MKERCKNTTIDKLHLKLTKFDQNIHKMTNLNKIPLLAAFWDLHANPANACSICLPCHSKQLDYTMTDVIFQ
jgi:hypothetical protein